MSELVRCLSNRVLQQKPLSGRARNRRVCFVFFLLLSVLNLTVMFMAYYPGVLSYDSIHQLWEILTGKIQNDHYPYFYTQLIGLLFRCGLHAFGTRNEAIACCSVFQILVMASVFAYVLSTMYEAGVPWTALILSLIWYLLMPYHIFFSFTMWKDGLYAGAGALMLTAVYRILTGNRSARRDGFLLALGMLGM